MIVGAIFPATIEEVAERFLSLPKDDKNTVFDCVNLLYQKQQKKKQEHTCKGNVISVDFKKVQER